MYLFLVYLTTLSVTQTIQRQENFWHTLYKEIYINQDEESFVPVWVSKRSMAHEV